MSPHENSMSDWWLRVLSVTFAVSPKASNFFPVLRENGVEIPASQVVAQEVEKLSSAQKWTIENLCGRYGPPKKIRQIAEEKGWTTGTPAKHKERAVTHLSKSPRLQNLTRVP